MARVLKKVGDVTANEVEDSGERELIARTESVQHLADDFLPRAVEDSIGGTRNGKPIFDHDQVIDQIDSGRTLATPNGTITYSFLTTPKPLGVYNNPNNGFPEPAGYSPMSEAQKTVAREGMGLWDDLIAPSIVEKRGAGADILFANTSTGPAQAWAYYPGQGYKYTSDVWTADPQVNWTNDWLNYSGYGWTTIVHEQGHALGLSHPGAYNFSANFSTTYANGAEYAQDSRQFSIMSYWDATNTGAQTIDVAVGLYNYPQTPMIHDILAIQDKYGADLTTRAGDTVYGFNSNAGRDIYDFSKNLAPNLAIYDAGGNDTLDLSGANSGVFIDLRPGSFSSAATRPTLDQANAATAQFNAATDAVQGDFALWTAASFDAYLDTSGTNRLVNIYNSTGVSGVMALSHYNISIAYNTIIENAVGGSERDYLVGNDVANILSGNGGDDILMGLAGNDTLNGGAGMDSVSYAGAKAGVTVSLADAGPHVTEEGSDTFVSIEGLIGSDFADVLTGDSGDNIINGLRGNDTLDGGAGNDILSFMGANAITFTLAESGSGSVTANVFGTDSYTSFEGVAGTVFADTITGNSSANVLKGDFGDDTLSGLGGDDTLYGEIGNDSLVGGEGNDTLFGGLGNDTLQGQNGNDTLNGDKGNDLLLGGAGDDALNGGEGTDSADWRFATTAIIATLVANGAGTASGEGADTMTGIENLAGGTAGDTLTGDAGANVLTGNGGDDILVGNAGNDTLVGGAGNDTLNGGDGIDTATFGTATTVNLTAGTATGGDGNDTLIGIENVTGSGAIDTITGNSGDNVLSGGGGNDVINGGDGNDTLSGDAGNDILNGEGGDDTLLGGAGDDTINGGAGTDTASFAGSGLAVTVNLALGTATGEGTDTLTGIENVTGSGAGDTLTGDGNANTLSGGAGNDTLDGGLGNDRLDGGAGNDLVTYAAAAAGVVVSLADANPHNTLMGSDTFISIEGIIGSAFNDTLTGDAAANFLFGGAGNDNLVGGDGNDQLSGGLGDDTLNGGNGSGDMAVYNASATGVTVNLVAGTATGEGSDTLIGIEHVTGSAFDDVITGSDVANTLAGGAGNDSLTGGGGNDTLTGDAGNDTLLGGAGNDTLSGGTGNDTIDGGDGTDTVNYLNSLTAVTVNLAALTATGEGSDSLLGIENVQGSNGNDVITGSNGANVLNGNGGNDTINGGLGADELTGGAGDDIFVIGNIDAVDKIMDFTTGLGTGNDKIDLSSIDANTLIDGDQAFIYLGDDAFSGVAGQLRYDGDTVSGDLNGDMIADFSFTVANHWTLQTTDFTL